MARPADGWFSDDGMWFKTKAEAVARDMAQSDEARATRYVELWKAAQDPEPAERAATLRHNVVMDFLQRMRADDAERELAAAEGASDAFMEGEPEGDGETVDGGESDGEAPAEGEEQGAQVAEQGGTGAPAAA